MDRLRRLCCPFKAFHDVEEFRNAYSRSAVTAESMVKRYSNPKLVLDIHRDATGNDPERL